MRKPHGILSTSISVVVVIGSCCNQAITLSAQNPVSECYDDFSPIIIRETRDILWAARCLQPVGVRSDADSSRQRVPSAIATEDLLSTSGWRELLADFATGPQTRLIAIKVMRVPGNPLIKGTFWLDDIKLKAIETGKESP